MESQEIAVVHKVSHVDWLRGLADDDVYQVSLDRPESVVFGICYRVDSNMRLIITALLSESPAELWNRNCEGEETICTGDTIVKVNNVITSLRAPMRLGQRIVAGRGRAAGFGGKWPIAE